MLVACRFYQSIRANVKSVLVQVSDRQLEVVSALNQQTRMKLIQLGVIHSNVIPYLA